MGHPSRHRPPAHSRWITQKAAFTADPHYRLICIDYDRCRDWPADDPRLIELADRILAWHAEHLATSDPEPGAADVDPDPSILAMIAAATSGSSAAWRQVAVLTRERIAATTQPDAN